MKSLHAAGLMLRHQPAAATKLVKFIDIAIANTQDPGPFRRTDQRRILKGEEGTHTIIAAVFANFKIRWVVTVHSRHSDKVEYYVGPDDQWGARIHSEIFGDDLDSEYDPTEYPELSLAPEAAPASLLDACAGDVQFRIRHAAGTDPCRTVPHEVESKALVGGYHEGVSIAQAFSADRKEVSKTRCR